MQPVRLLAGLAIWLSFSCLTLAQPAPRKEVRQIEVEEAKVYSGPGDQTMLTGILRRGARVEVIREVPGGWLEIAPPDGSFSWINDRFVQRFGGGLRVASRTPVQMRVGSVITPDQPTIVQTGAVQEGTQLVPLRGQPVQVDGSRWWPVLPNASEKRCIQKAAVGSVTVAAGQGPVGEAGAQPRPSVAPTPTTPQASPERTRTLWQQAQDAERGGNSTEAIQLYDELARVTNEDSLRLLALNRAQFLRDSQRAGPRTPPTRPEPVRQPPPAAPIVQPRGVPGKPAVPAYPVGTAPPTGMGTAPAVGAPTRSVGRLERAAFFVDNRRTYALVSSEGLPRMYVTAEDGVNLEAHVNRNVEVTGPTVYRGDLRTNYMRVTQVQGLGNRE